MSARVLDRATIAHRRLQHQRMSGKPCATAVEAVRWLCAVQSQDYANAKWAVGLRVANAVDGDVERAFNDGEILRTHLLRPTWHFVTPADIHWLLALTAPRVQKLCAPQYRRLELDPRVLRRSIAAIEGALRDGEQLTRTELRQVLDRARVPTGGEQRMTYLMMNAELSGVICSGARRGKQFTYALLHARAPDARLLEHDEAAAELARRFYLSRGPATVHDFARWSGLTLTVSRAALEEVKSDLREDVVDGTSYWSPPTAPDRTAGALTTHLLSIYDEYISGYRDRSAVVEPRFGPKLVGLGNALSAIVVLDGQVVGTWKRTFRRDAVVVSPSLFTPVSRAGQREIDAAIERYAAFVQLPARVTPE